MQKKKMQISEPETERISFVSTPFRINTRTHSNVRREEAARCSASCVDRSDRSLGAVRPVAAGRTVTKPTNVSPGRPVGAGACRVVLGSAGHLGSCNRVEVADLFASIVSRS